MIEKTDFKRLLSKVDFSDEKSLLTYAEHLEGMTFQDVLDLEIFSPKARAKRERAVAKEKAYARSSFKGGVGNLVEERYFAYDANSDGRPDFADAGVELKTTCYDLKTPNKSAYDRSKLAQADGRVPSAGERLSVTMIPFDRDIAAEFDSSHVWEKMHRVLLVFYQRDKSVGRYDQAIRYVVLFTPPEKDLQIIREDYRTIATLVREGRADELSEGLTTYLGAATKGQSEATMWVTQHYPRIHEDGTVEYRKAKRRVFSLKRQYMDFVLNRYAIPERERAHRLADQDFGHRAWKPVAEVDSRDSEEILKTPLAKGETFEDRLRFLVGRYVGKSDHELCELFGFSYDAENKSGWTRLNRRILGVTGPETEEFKKANIHARAIRVEEEGNIEQHVPLPQFKFLDLAAEKSWEESELHEQLETSRFFFTVFRKSHGTYYLHGCLLWNMSEHDIDGEARRCWERAREVVRRGVKLTPDTSADGVRVMNDLPGSRENHVVHVRPHASKSAYLFADGSSRGNVERDAYPLPDGRWMTKQSFWIDKRCVQPLLSKI